MKTVQAAALFMGMLLLALLPACAANTTPRARHVRILATSDLHGRIMPWDYAMNREDTSGSMAQLASAIAGNRDEQTLLVDAGDLIQGNLADYFVHRGGVHPMVRAMNGMGYDIWVTGNHDYNYGMDVLRGTMDDLEAQVLTGNVYDTAGDPIAKGYTILEKDGVRIAVIGMVTPNIARWDAKNLEGCAVTDPLEETRKILDAIEGQYDLLVGVFHMGIENEYGVPNSGVEDICNACPEFDVMIASHEHKLIESMDINGVLVVENRQMAQTMSVIDITLEPSGSGWKAAQLEAKSVSVADYEPDPEMTALLKEDHEDALEESQRKIGVLTGGPLVPEEEGTEGIASGTELPAAQVRDTPLIELINRVQLHYAGARVSATALTNMDSNLEEGDIHLYDAARIYSFGNTLYCLRMNGSQLKKLMEWTAGYFETVGPDHPEITAVPGFAAYNYLMFDGVHYEIDLTKPAGERITSLTWPDGSPVDGEEQFLIAMNNYNASSEVLVPGVIFEEEELPELVEMDVRGDIGGVRELICDYIVHEKNGVLRPECDHNWRIILPGQDGGSQAPAGAEGQG